MMMMNTGIPEVSNLRDVEFLKESLKPHLSELEALAHFREKFSQALKGKRSAEMNNFWHLVAHSYN